MIPFLRMRHRLRFQYAIRSLFPVWRFFDEVDSSVSLYLRPEGSADQEWCKVDPSHSIKLWNLFLNPEGLLVHAFHNFIRIAHRERSSGELDPMVQSMANQIGKKIFPDAERFEYFIAGEEP